MVRAQLLDPGDLVDDEAVVGIDVEELADVGAVTDLHLPDQMVAAGATGNQAAAEDHRSTRLGPQVGRVALLAHELGGDRRRLLGANRRSDRSQVDLGHHRAVDGFELAAGGEVEAQLGAEHGHAEMLLAEAEVFVAEPVGEAAAWREVADGIVEPERLSVAREEAAAAVLCRGAGQLEAAGHEADQARRAGQLMELDVRRAAAGALEVLNRHVADGLGASRRSRQRDGQTRRQCDRPE